MNDGLPQHEIELLNGKEPFHGPGITQPLLLIDYWRWQGSALLDNTSRGIMAEFLVAAALDLHRKPRREWDESDIRMASGSSIEVKSSAYVQSWEQSRPSVIEFGIAPHRSWNAETGEYREGVKRWADIYIFCVFTGKKPLHSLDTSKWDFYVLPTEVLDREVPEQKTIRLSSLEKLSPRRCPHAELKKTISDVENGIKSETSL